MKDNHLKGVNILANTKDNNKKAKDHNARNAARNEQVDQNFKAGKHQYSKSTDHL